MVQKLGVDYIALELQCLLLSLEPAQRNHVGVPGQRLPYRFQMLARDLELPTPRDSTVRDLVKLLCDEESFAIIAPRASNDYWLLRLLIAGYHTPYYSYGFPIWTRDALMGTYCERRKLRAPIPPTVCPAVPQPQPTLLDAVSTGAYLIGQNGALVPNALLIDEQDRHFEVKSGLCGGFRFDDADGSTPPPGPYKTKAEAHAYSGAWESSVDTIGECSICVDLKTWTPPRPANPTPVTSGAVASTGDTSTAAK